MEPEQQADTSSLPDLPPGQWAKPYPQSDGYMIIQDNFTPENRHA